MFIGHFGVGFAAKKISSKPSLGTLFFAAQFIDLIWPLLLLLGLEQVEINVGDTKVTPLNFVSYPISHSLLSVVLWALLIGYVYYLIHKNIKTSVLLGLLVFSHWILDFITHRPDLPLIPWNDTLVGLGLWNSLMGTVILEGLIFAIGVYFYASLSKAKNRTGIYSQWGLVIFLAIIYSGNLFGSVPPSARSVAIVSLAQWLLVAWGYWIDRNREFVN